MGYRGLKYTLRMEGAATVAGRQGIAMGSVRTLLCDRPWAGLLLLATLPVFASDSVALSDSTPRVALSSHVGYYHDAAAEGLASRRSPTSSRKTRSPACPGRSAAFGFQNGAYWFHVRLLNRSQREQRWLLVQQYALSDHLDVYAHYPDGRTAALAGGDSLPFNAGPQHPLPPPELLARPAAGPAGRCVRARAEPELDAGAAGAVHAGRLHRAVSRDAQLGMGMYYGILLALFFYNLVLWLTLRDASYFWYLLHIGAFGLVLFTLNGLGFEYLWPSSPWLADKSVPLSICLAQIGMQQFARTFLGLRERWRLGRPDLPGPHRLLSCCSAWLRRSCPTSISTPIASASVFLSIGWVAVLGLVVVRRGYKPAIIFLLAWAMFLLGTACSPRSRSACCRRSSSPSTARKSARRWRCCCCRSAWATATPPCAARTSASCASRATSSSRRSSSAPPNSAPP